MTQQVTIPAPAGSRFEDLNVRILASMVLYPNEDTLRMIRNAPLRFLSVKSSQICSSEDTFLKQPSSLDRINRVLCVCVRVGGGGEGRCWDFLTLRVRNGSCSICRGQRSQTKGLCLLL